MMSAAASVAAFCLRFTMMRETSANPGCACDARALGSPSRRNKSCGQVVGMLSKKSATDARWVSPERLSSSVPDLTKVELRPVVGVTVNLPMVELD